MNLRVLKSFLVVCQTGNITKAADALHISQPALSRQMQDLEEEVGTPLLVRGKRQVSLTAAGLHYQMRVRELLALSENAAREAKEAAGKGELTGQVRIGVVESRAMALLAREISRWQKEHPRVQFNVYSGNGDAIGSKLDRGELDYGIVIEPVEVAKYRVLKYPVRERWGFIVREGSPLWGRESVTLAEAKKRPLILPFRNLVEDEVAGWFAELPGPVRTVARINLSNNAISLMRATDCDALVNEGAFAMRPVPGFMFVPLDPPKYTGHRLIRRKQDRLSRAAAAFWDQLSALCNEEASRELGTDEKSPAS